MTSRVRVIFTLAALSALGPLSIDMYLPAFPELQRDLHASPASLSATLATFFVGLCLGQLIYGPWSDRSGRKKPLIFGLVVYIAASVGCTMVGDVETLIVLRFFQALGSCSGMVIGRALVRDLFEPRETARIFSLIILSMGLAPVLAPLMGNYLTSHLGWRAIFWSTAAFAGLALFAVLGVVENQRGSAVGGLSLRAVKSIMTHREFLGFALSGTFIQAGFFAYLTGSPHFYVDQLGYTPHQFSLMFGGNALGLIAMSQLNSHLLRQQGYRPVLQKTLYVALASGLLFMVASLLWPQFAVAPLFVFVATLGLIFPNSTAGALADQKEHTGTASAILGTIQYGGAALAAAAVGALSGLTVYALQWIVLGCAVLAVGTFLKLLAFSPVGLAEAHCA